MYLTSQHTILPSARYRIVAGLLVSSLILGGAAMATPLSVEWAYPAWATPSKPFKGEARLEVPADAKVYLHYAKPGGTDERIPCKTGESEEGIFRFTIPAQDGSGGDKLPFWLEADAPNSGVQTSKRQSVPMSDEVEIEVSGHTDQELTYPMSDWGAAILFRPCCLIIAGWITAERIPVLPAPTSEGLPSTLLSPYFRVDPDQLVKATGGVNVRVSYTGSKPGVDPQSIRPYHWKDGRWSPVFDPVLDAKNRNVTFPFPSGGIFVIGGNSSK